jgi:hypothetical protein
VDWDGRDRAAEWDAARPQGIYFRCYKPDIRAKINAVRLRIEQLEDKCADNDLSRAAYFVTVIGSGPSLPILNGRTPWRHRRPDRGHSS